MSLDFFLSVEQVEMTEITTSCSRQRAAVIDPSQLPFFSYFTPHYLPLLTFSQPQLLLSSLPSTRLMILGDKKLSCPENLPNSTLCGGNHKAQIVSFHSEYTLPTPPISPLIKACVNVKCVFVKLIARVAKIR